MPPRRIKKDPTEGWLTTEDGTLVNPNSEEGLRMQGLLKPPPPEAAYTEEIVPCNEAATMASMPLPDNGLLLHQKLPTDCEVFKMHVADDSFPDAPPVPAVTCDADDLPKVLDALLGDRMPPRYKNLKTGLEFEWTVPPAGFYAPPPGWGKPKIVALDEKE